MTLEEKQQSLIADLNLIPDAQERLAALGSRASEVHLPEAQKSDDLIVAGCVSRVWLDGRLNNGVCHFVCAADSPMVHSLVITLCQLYSDVPPTEVVQVEPEIWEACGFQRMLSPTRLNGLAALRSRIRTLAQGFLAQ